MTVKYEKHYDEKVLVLTADPKLNGEVIKLVTSTDTLNVREKPPRSDWSPEIAEYLKYCGISRPAWWCAAFVSYQIHRSSTTSGVTSNWPRFANCVDIYHWGRKQNVLSMKPIVASVVLSRET
jgi:hypothetical protein